MKIEVEIEWEGKPAKVVLKRLTWGEANEIIRKCIGKVKIVGNEPSSVSFDIVLWKEELLLKSLVEAPFPITMEGIRGLPAELGEKLYRKAEELNPFLKLF